MKLFGVTAGQFVKVGLIAVVFIIALKTVNKHVGVPGLSALIEQV